MTDENHDDDYDGMQEHYASSSSSSSHRDRILSLIETFIDQIFHIRKTLLGVSISAVIMAPIAIGLSVYLLRHPSFLAVLEIENEFGIVLGVLLGAIIIISSIWLVVGIRQYRLIGSWNKDTEIISEKSKKEIELLHHNMMKILVLSSDTFFFMFLLW